MLKRSLTTFALGIALANLSYAQDETKDTQSTASTTDKPAWSVLNAPAEKPDNYDFDKETDPADEWQSPQMIRPIAGAAFAIGLSSDNINNTNNPTTTKKIDAGRHIHLYGGIALAVPGTAYQTQIILGYMTNRNSDGVFNRYPLSIIPTWESNRHRFGAGLTYHLNAKFDAKNSNFENNAVDQELKSRIGTVLEYDFKFNDSWSLGVSMLNIRYKNNDLNRVARGSSLALNTKLFF